MNSSEIALSHTLTQEEEMFLSFLKMYTIVDIGMIHEITEEGRATVSTGRFSGKQQVVYRNVEVVYPGNNAGAFTCTTPGTTCLIFMPLSCMPSIKEQKFRTMTPAYNKDGIKAMPISTGLGTTIRSSYDDSGELSISADTWTLLFKEMGITLTQDSKLIMSKLREGELFMRRFGTESATTTVNINDAGITKELVSSDGKCITTLTMTNEGDVSILQKNDEDKELANIAVNKGVVSISINGNTFSIDEGGNLSITTEGNLTLSGKNVAINSTGDGSSVQINGNNLKVDK